MLTNAVGNIITLLITLAFEHVFGPTELVRNQTCKSPFLNTYGQYSLPCPSYYFNYLATSILYIFYILHILYSILYILYSIDHFIVISFANWKHKLLGLQLFHFCWIDVLGYDAFGMDGNRLWIRWSKQGRFWWGLLRKIKWLWRSQIKYYFIGSHRTTIFLFISIYNVQKSG